MKRWVAKEQTQPVDPRRIKCAVFDFGFTLSKDYYFKIAPHGYPHWREVIQEHIFRDPEVLNSWMKGDLGSRDIAGLIGKYIPLDLETILAVMDEGCRQLSLNLPVWNFAVQMKMTGRKIALVTGNMDVFTRVVVPAHKLDRTFDAILNSADEHELRKEILWQKAFDLLDGGIGFDASLLVDDSEIELDKFRKLGGYAHQYVNDKSFNKWVHSIDWDKEIYGQLA